MKRNISENNGRSLPVRSTALIEAMTLVVLPDGNGGFMPCPELLTEEELILFLRIPNISNAKNYSNVIDHLKRMYGLPRIHICGKVLYPIEAIKDWIRKKTTYGK